MDATQLVLSVLLPTIVAVAVARRGFRVDNEYVAQWARSGDLELTPERSDVVRSYLEWTRRCRSVGGLIGFLAPVVYSAMILREPLDDSGSSVASMFLGYLIGALLSEVLVFRAGRRSGIPAGSRRFADYLPRGLVRLQRGLGAVSLAVAVIYPFLEPHARTSVPAAGAVAAWGVAAACFAALIEIFERGIVARRGATMSDLEVDGAMRSSALHVISGTALFWLINLAGASAAVCLLAVLPEAASGVGIPLVLLVFATALFAWLRMTSPDGFRARVEGRIGAVP